MGKIIQIEVPEWVDEKDVKEVVKRYIELKLSNGLTKEEYIDFVKIDVDEIVEYDLEEESKILEELRKKAKERCRF